MSLASGDLTTLANVKAYLSGPPADVILQRLIPAMSRTILSALNRTILVPKSYTEQYNGTGTTELVLPNWPLLDSPLLTLTISGTTITIAPQDSDVSVARNPFGFRYQPWEGDPPGFTAVVELVGGAFYSFGNQNVVISYSAGYQISNEAFTVPIAPGPYVYTPLAPYGIWATDRGVKYSATGVALTAITSGTPAVGQYIPPTPGATTPVLNYTFAAADAGVGLLASYGYIPFDVEQVCIDLIGERAAYRSRIGIRSQSLAGQETISYDTSGLTKYIQGVLNPYMSVIPPNLGANV